MKMTTGTPAVGDDFFPREPETNALWDLAERGHTLLLAPRRVGKTSLLKHFEHNPREGWRCLYLSVEGAANEGQFVSRLATTLYQAYPEGSWGTRFGESLRNLFSEATLKVGPFQVQLASAIDAGWQETGRAALEALRESKVNTLLLIDEFPIFVRKSLVSRAPGGHPWETELRARIFLDWFREMRSALVGAHKKVNFLLTGSIGLHSIVEAIRMTGTINDLATFRLGPLDRANADQMLVRLSEGEGLALSGTVRERFLDLIDWAIPYHFQLLFLEVRRMSLAAGVAVSPELVDQAFESLLTPSNRSYFRHWVERLEVDYLTPPEIDLKKALLDAASQGVEGIGRDAIVQIHQRVAPKTSAEGVLLSLEHDGYLVLWQERWRFASSLLRKWWQRWQVERQI